MLDLWASCKNNLRKGRGTIDRQRVRNFLQDFGCAKLEHLQILFDSKNDNFKWLLAQNMISKKDNVFVHNTKQIDEKMLIALDVLCKFKGRYINYQMNNEPVVITFYTKQNLTYNIIVANNENKKRIVNTINNSAHSQNKCDKIIALFQDDSEFKNINSEITVYYVVYPDLIILNEVPIEL